MEMEMLIINIFFAYKLLLQIHKAPKFKYN